MIIGMTDPTDGEIEIMGKKVEFGNNDYRDVIGFLPDVPGFYDWMTAREFLLFSGGLYDIPKEEVKSRTDELLKLVNLNKSRNKKIGKFSRGMKQRLGIAQALINNPKIILLDEPVSALDPIGRKEVMDVIGSLAGKVTVFFSTHILEDVERICDRVIIINEGKKILEDSLENIKKIPDVRSLEIELENEKDIQYLLAIEPHSIVYNIKQDKNKIVISSHDINQVRTIVNKIVYENDIMFKKMFIQSVSLEEIFIKAVNGNG